MKIMKIKYSLYLSIFTSSLIIVFNNNALADTQCNKAIYGILTPMTSESYDIEKEMTSKETKIIDHVKYHIGKIAGKNIVLVNSGIGLINAAAITTSLIKDFHPCELLLSGTSGSINKNLKVGDVVIAKSIFNADYGKLTSHGIELNIAHYPNPQDGREFPLVYKTNFNMKKAVLSIPAHLNYQVILGIIADTDNLPNETPQVNLLRENKVDVIAMEGAAVSQTCWLFKTKCLIIRAVSNIAGEEITDQGTALAAKNAATIAINIIRGNTREFSNDKL